MVGRMSDTNEDKPEPSPFERMTDLAAKVMAVPKAELDRRDAEWKRQRAQIASDRYTSRP